MGYANCIGRVGGLAVALGVGMAVSAAPGVAWADAADSGNASASAGDTSSAPASRGPSRAARSARAASSVGSGATGRSTRVSAPSDTGRSRRDSVLTKLPKSAIDRIHNQGNSAPAANPTADVVDNTPASASTAAPVNVSVAAPVAAASAPAAARAAAAVSVGTAAPAPAAAVASAVKPVQILKSVLRSLIFSGKLGFGQLDTFLGALDAIRRALGRLNQSVPAATVSSSATPSPNLLFNSGAELASPTQSGFTSATIPGWTVTGTPTVIAYGTPRTIWSVGTSFPMPNLPNQIGFPKKSVGPNVDGTPTGGDNFFGGGPLADSTISQLVDLSAASTEIDTGTVGYNLSAWLGGYTLDPSAASVKVTFLDANGDSLGTAKLRKVGLLDRLFATSFKQRTATGLLPTDTRSALVEVTFTDNNPVILGLNARYNDAFADNISFTVDADLPEPVMTPPVSTVGELDHVFMVYMENKGYSDIVGSDLAPYLNSLIEQYGFSENYYALTHGSLPNYYPIVGGSNFGITYNCDSPCMDATTLLTTNLDSEFGALGWRSYAQSLQPGQNPLESGGDYSFDQTAFPAFTEIAKDQAYAEAHIVPLEQMAIDLQSEATTPKFVWWAADEDNNGEGPVDTIPDMLKFVLNQIDPKHPYNIPALDQFLSETVPTILDSAVWNDPTIKSAVVVTFDEDNNNTYLGFSRDNNHVVTVVIPSPGAIAAGMRSGSFTTSQLYDHYSLLRTIEEALGLPAQYGYLSENDEWAIPMNDFWT